MGRMPRYWWVGVLAGGLVLPGCETGNGFKAKSTPPPLAANGGASAAGAGGRPFADGGTCPDCRPGGKAQAQAQPPAPTPPGPFTPGPGSAPANPGTISNYRTTPNPVGPAQPSRLTPPEDGLGGGTAVGRPASPLQPVAAPPPVAEEPPPPAPPGMVGTVPQQLPTNLGQPPELPAAPSAPPPIPAPLMTPAPPPGAGLPPAGARPTGSPSALLPPPPQ